MTPGSNIEEKTSSVVWHYRNSDPEFGSWKANQLVAELYEMLSNLPVEIHHGKKIVEVSSIQINKGSVMEYFMLLN
jgi:trehalose 6-phosphate synthase/phosphatase